MPVDPNSSVRFGFAALLAAICVGAGCSPAHAAVADAATVALIHLPGIAGEMPIDHSLIRGLIAGGVAPTARIIDWTGDDRGIPALTNVARHHEQAKRVADAIVAACQTDPAARVVLVGHSAGTGIAVEALQDLPAGVNVQTLVLLASALSPDYDLTDALRHVNGRAIVLHSRLDDAVLGAGTKLFGTYDRVHSEAAGLTGFRMPAGADAAEYAKLVQVPFDPRWRTLGNSGEHIGPMSARFAKTILSPLIEGRPLPTTWPTAGG